MVGYRRKKSVGLRSKYVKIPLKTKIKFLRKVVLQGISIRDSSTIFNINYSTAKTLIRQYKSDLFEFDLNLPTEETNPYHDDYAHKMVRCSYRIICSEQEWKTGDSERTPSFYLSDSGRKQSSGLVQQLKKIEVISTTSF